MPPQDYSRAPMTKREYETQFRIEDFYWWHEGVREVARSFISSKIKPSGNLHVLDAGCGTGGNLKFLGNFGEVYGVEISKEAGVFLRERNFNRFAEASVTEMPFADNTFDLVTAFYVNEYLEDDTEAIMEYYRVLKPGGCFYISEVAYESLRGEHDLAVGVVHRYTRRELVERISAQGFNVLRSSYFNTLLLPPIFLTRRLRRIFKPVSGKEEAVSDFGLAPAPLHPLFRFILFMEARILRFINLPFGASVAALAEKPLS